MSTIIQVPFEVSDEIMRGLNAGTLIRYGGVVRNKAGSIVDHLDEIAIISQDSSKTRNMFSSVMDYLTKNKTKVIGITVIIALIGGVVYIVRKNKKGKKEVVAVPKCVVDFNKALLEYVARINKSKVTETSIDKVLTSLRIIKENQDKGIIDGELSYENAEILFEMVRNYTEELVCANNLKMPLDSGEESDKIINLQNYLETQKRVFKRAK